MTDAIKTILLVDDEERLLNSMAQRLTLLGFEAIKVSSGTKAIEIANKTKLDLAIVDLKMPDMDGLTTITKLKEIIPDLKTVLLTGYGSKKIHQKTDDLGAEYFEKDSMGDLWDLIKQFKPEVPKEKVDSFSRTNGDLPKIIGETPGMQRLRKDVERFSGLDCTIIIQGETGTGKELAARTIHGLSHRRDQRFLAFNCGCFSNDFHFNELLGSLEEPAPHFTSTRASSREARFIGTILLDNFEIMPEQTRQEMIKIMDKMAETRSKGTVDALRNIRFIVATHQDIKKKVAAGKFNKALYLRLNAIVMSMPSLKERRDDIPPLCSYFLSKLNKEFGKNIESISHEVFSIFMSYPFPGNVRELKHIIERAVILADGSTIEQMHLPERFTKKSAVSAFLPLENQNHLTLGEMEQKHILKVLKITKGNKSKTAELLGISRAALWRKLKLINAG